MSYADLIRRAWEQNVLFSVLVELTYKCNLNCFYCYNDRNQQGRLLATGQYCRLFEDLRDLGVLELILSGGEPLLHPDFFLLGARARELGFVIRIKSNGHALNKETIKRMRAEIAPFMVDLSLHGASPGVHDRQTGVAGSFERLLSNLDMLTQQKQRFRLNLILTAWNEHEIKQMFPLAHSYGIPLNVSMTISPRDNGGTKPLSIVPSETAISETIGLLHAQAAGSERREGASENGFVDCDIAPEKPPKQCGSASSTLAVDPFGNILPCVQWRLRAGSLHEQSIKEIWDSSELLQKVRGITRQVRMMTEKQWPESHGGAYCPGLAKALTGSPFQEYDQAAVMRKAMKRIQ